MYLIVGLGNPENEENFKNSRHNMGFDVINVLSKRFNIPVTKNKFDGLVGKGEIAMEEVILLKPQTYMNLSGKSVVQAANFYKVKLKNILIIYDDIDTPIGSIRIRKKGTAGSHKGMQSVVQELGDTNIARIRVGIDRPEFTSDMINYVIGSIPKEQWEGLNQGIEKAADAVEESLKHGIDIAMNKYN